MAEFISEEEFLKLQREKRGVDPNADMMVSDLPPVGGAEFISEEEFLRLQNKRNTPNANNPTSTLGAYLKAVPSTAVDITLGAGEGFASAIGEFTGDYGLARKIGSIREDVNDAIMGDVPDELQSDFIYKLSSGLGSTLPYLGAALLSRNPRILTKLGAGGFFLSSAGQQVRDDYLASQGVTSENATDEQMQESNVAGALGAIPIALAERLGAGLILRPFAKGAIPAGKVMERISQYAAAGAGEALTEATQSGLINSIASYVRKYDPDRPITAGMAESAVIGFLVGGGVNAAVDTVNRRMTQADRLKAGVQDGSINAKDVIDPEVGSKLTEIAIENDGIPEADTNQQAKITDPQGWKNFVSKTLTPITRRLGRAGKEVVREFRKYELETGIKTKELKQRILTFQQEIQKLKKTNPEDYKTLSLALANANELAASLPNSTKRKLEKKAQLQPSVTRSQSEQLLDETNPFAQQINTQIEQAREALSQRGMKTRIEVVEEGNSFYDPTANAIVISAEQADGTTVAHEFFHAALGQAVKTDAELQSMTRNMFDSVIRATVDGSSLNEQLKGFVSQYDQNIQNEEFLAQTVGELARQYQTLDLNTKTRIKIWINQAMQALGMGGVFKQADTDAEVVEQLNAFARFAGDPEALTNKLQPKSLIQPDNYLTQPIRATKFSLKDLTLAPKVTFPSKQGGLSLVTDKVKNGVGEIDIINLINKAIDEDATITFWGADQFGFGVWTDPVTGETINIDGGISYPLSPLGGKAVWATAKSASELNKLMQSDYVFLYSGKPETMHTFNKLVRTAFENRIKQVYKNENDWKKAFADEFIKLKDRTRRAGKFSKLEEQVIAFGNDQLDDLSFTESGKFIKDLYLQSSSIKDDSLVSFLNRVLPDLDSMRDGFLKENGFGYMDIYGVFKPSGVKEGKSGHSTYANSILGDVIEKRGGKDIRFGIPNRVISLKDMLSDETLGDIDSLAEAQERRVAESTFTGGAAGVKTRPASEFRRTTPQQVSDAIEREKAATPAKPATAEQMARGAKALRKQQLPRTPIVTPKVRGTKAFKKWFGDGTLVHSDGEPMVFYHGTKEDITEFKPRSKILKDWVFFSTDPELSVEMAMRKPLRSDIANRLDDVSLRFAELSQEQKDALAQRYTDQDQVISLPLTEEGKAREQFEKEALGMDVTDFVDLGGMNVIPAYLNAKEIFDPRNEGDTDRLYSFLETYKEALTEARLDAKDKSEISELNAEILLVNNLTKEKLRDGFYGDYEIEAVSDALKSLGYDGIILSEMSADSGDYNLSTIAVWNGASGIKSATGNTGAYSSEDPDIRYQKKRTASDKERIRGLADEGLRVLEKHGMVNSYTEVRRVLEQLKDEYQSLGLDMNYIDNYFPRLMEDLEGFKKSIGQTVGVDEEIRRYENMTGQKLTAVERQKMYEKLARSRLYRGGVSQPKNLKERRKDEVKASELQYYADPEVALDEYVDRMVQTIETKKLIGDAQAGKTRGQEAIAGRLGQVMEQMAEQGRLRQDQIEVIQGAVAARFGQHGRQYGFVKGMKNAGYLATMGNTGSTLTQLGDFYFTMVQNGLIPTIQSMVGSKALTVEDLGIAKDLITIETKDGKGFMGKAVDNVFKITGLTAMDRLAKNTNINAAYRVLQKGAKSNPNSRAYAKTLSRLKRTQGNDAYKTIADLQQGKKSDYVIEALYNELADVAPISLSEMPENYANNPNLRILYSLKSYTIKQFNFVRERAFSQIMEGIATGDPKKFSKGSLELTRILAFGALANGSADVLKAILFNREINDEDFWWNHFLRLFGITKYTTVTARKKGVGEAIVKSVLPPQAGILDDIFRDVAKGASEEGIDINEMRSMKYFPVVGKLYYWREGKGVEVEEKLSRLREK